MKRIELHKKKFEVYFAEGIPDRESERRKKLTYPEEIIDKKCGGCVRCRPKILDGGKVTGFHCTKLPYDRDIHQEDKACTDYWDRAEDQRLKILHDKDVEERRQYLWSIYANREPIKLPISYDGFGYIPQCPICGEMPYSTTQCHWCGQRFIQDKEIEEYATPITGHMDCFSCGGKGTVEYMQSKYNGHKRGHCTKCGTTFIE